MKYKDVLKSDLPIKDKIGVIQRLVLLHSYLYYELDDSRISDKEYDLMCKKLVELQKEFRTDDTHYEGEFVDFDGSTRFDLWSRLTERQKDIIKSIAANRNNHRARDRRNNEKKK